ncbi:glyoxalase/bleomycin resistance/dioxygenase family protein [Nocardia crassostreae]|uniref:glyoxalase/bleomycin resistance/dioxygenase family protein n=1 Tax=Nocardia crassostreae TaxID=53428 RepID=UPI00082C0C79|nr:glyoxalase/bleomycin resistance/dioxygenase family protein [Nocardia crassostreae]
MAVLETLARVYVDDLNTALPTFTALTGLQPGLRFPYQDLELARIGDYLLIAGTPEALAPYRGTHATTIVDDLDAVLALLAETNADILDGPNDVPTGRNLTVRHPGGAQIEYVEFDTAKLESVAP